VDRASPSAEDCERIEQAAWMDLAAIVPPSLASAFAIESYRFQGTFQLLAARMPVYQFNWLNGAGLQDDVDAASIDMAIDRFLASGQRKFFVQIPPGAHAAACESRAAARGLAPHALAWAKFARPTSMPPNVQSALEIRSASPDDAARFGATAAAAFGMPPSLGSWLSAIVRRPGWHCYLAIEPGSSVACGTGALYIEGDVAWLGIGGVLPAHRKQGGQSALLAHRIAEAARLGARAVVTETGVPQAGQPAPSYRNILASGFEVRYVRPNWALTEQR
jgi:GNAT superfamily N-acetyltransferase